MNHLIPPYHRIRTLAMSFGLALGMAAGAYAPQMAQAASKASAKVRHIKKQDKGPETITALPPADADQLAAMDRVLYGDYPCEFGKTVTITRSRMNNGYVTLNLAQQSWVMKPVASSTGAIRLEDVKGQTLMLQILTKSMLLDVQSGHRLVDGCVHAVQKAAEEELRQNPIPSAFAPSPAASNAG